MYNPNAQPPPSDPDGWSRGFSSAPREAWNSLQADPHANASAVRRATAMGMGPGAASMMPPAAQQGRAPPPAVPPGAREAAERALAARVASMVSERQQQQQQGGGRPAAPMAGGTGIAAGSGMAALRASGGRPGTAASSGNAALSASNMSMGGASGAELKYHLDAGASGPNGWANGPAGRLAAENAALRDELRRLPEECVADTARPASFFRVRAGAHAGADGCVRVVAG